MRVKNSIFNTIGILVQRYAILILAFISKTIFVNTLGKGYNGVNTLFGDIFNMLALMELGVGAAFTFYLYEPLAAYNQIRVNSLMKLYKKIYNRIGIIVAIVGLALMPFLDTFTKTKSTEDINLYAVYIILLINVVLGYFMSYKRSMFTADQKNYVNSYNLLFFEVVKYIVQICLVVFFQNYMAYLIVGILFTIIANLQITLYANKKYPYLKEPAEELTKEEKRHIYSRVKAIFSHKVGEVVLYSTDSILLTYYAGFDFIGVYGMYILIVKMIETPISQVFSAMVASVGNLNETASKEYSEKIFHKVFFLNFYIFGFAILCLYFLLETFVTQTWLNNDFSIPHMFVVLLLINTYISGMRSSAGLFCTAKGLFYNTRHKPLFEAGINLVLSLTLPIFIGPIGVLVGTFISLMLTSFWVDAYVLYKHWFKKSVINYFVIFFKYTLVMFLTGLVTYFLLNILVMYTSSFIIRLIVCVITVNVCFITAFSRTEEFKYYLKLVKSLVYKIKNRRMKEGI